MEDCLTFKPHNQLHLFHPFSSSSPPVFSILLILLQFCLSVFRYRSCFLYWCHLSLYSLSFTTPAASALLSITFTSAAVITLLPYFIALLLHLHISLCSIFLYISSSASVSLLQHLPLSFAIFPSPPSIPHSFHPLVSRVLDGKPHRWKAEVMEGWREENN